MDGSPIAMIDILESATTGEIIDAFIGALESDNADEFVECLLCLMRTHPASGLVSAYLIQYFEDPYIPALR